MSIFNVPCLLLITIVAIGSALDYGNIQYVNEQEELHATKTWLCQAKGGCFKLQMEIMNSHENVYTYNELAERYVRYYDVVLSEIQGHPDMKNSLYSEVLSLNKPEIHSCRFRFKKGCLMPLDKYCVDEEIQLIDKQTHSLRLKVSAKGQEANEVLGVAIRTKKTVVDSVEAVCSIKYNNNHEKFVTRNVVLSMKVNTNTKHLLYTLKSFSGIDPYQMFINPKKKDDVKEFYNFNNLPDFYRSVSLDKFSELSFHNITVVLIKDKIVKFKLVFKFDTSQTSESWFKAENLIYSYPHQLPKDSKKYNFFSIKGEHVRHFFINFKYGGCPADVGVMVIVSKAKFCKWDITNKEHVPEVITVKDISQPWQAAGNKIVMDRIVIYAD